MRAATIARAGAVAAAEAVAAGRDRGKAINNIRSSVRPKTLAHPRVHRDGRNRQTNR